MKTDTNKVTSQTPTREIEDSGIATSRGKGKEKDEEKEHEEDSGKNAHRAILESSFSFSSTSSVRSKTLRFSW